MSSPERRRRMNAMVDNLRLRENVEMPRPRVAHRLTRLLAEPVKSFQKRIPKSSTRDPSHPTPPNSSSDQDDKDGNKKGSPLPTRGSGLLSPPVLDSLASSESGPSPWVCSCPSIPFPCRLASTLTVPLLVPQLLPQHLLLLSLPPGRPRVPYLRAGSSESHQKHIYY
ncbi:hypothetical protein QR685DRAFT_142053 [Neurospora intermedia]|uniref:Uncharacterized protein n=1 Tax=Neurospora intermedia TaxID=5142 RepID=A0ABR3CXN5_NEUIN